MSDDLPPVRVHHPHVESRPERFGGSPLVRGTKVPVRRLWQWHRRGVTCETLVKRYPALGAAKVLDALAFAYDNEDMLEADLARELAILDSEARSPSLPPPKRTREPAMVEIPPMHIRRHAAGLQPNGEPLPASDRSDDYVPSHCKRDDGSSPVGVCGGSTETCSCECYACVDPR